MDIFCMVLSVLTAVCSLIVACCVRRTRARWEDAVKTWRQLGLMASGLEQEFVAAFKPFSGSGPMG